VARLLGDQREQDQLEIAVAEHAADATAAMAAAKRGAEVVVVAKVAEAAAAGEVEGLFVVAAVVVVTEPVAEVHGGAPMYRK